MTAVGVPGGKTRSLCDSGKTRDVNEKVVQECSDRVSTGNSESSLQ